MCIRDRLEKYSFSLGDPGAGSLKRATAEAKTTSERSSSSYAGGAPGWGGGGTVNLSDGGEADAGGGWSAVDEMENEEKIELSGGSNVSSNDTPLRGNQKPFWVITKK